MSKNLLWMVLLLVIASCATGYSLLFAYRYYNYTRLTEKQQITSLEWNNVEKSSEEHVLIGKYTYTVNGILYGGETTKEGRPYFSAWAAKKAIDSLNKDTFVAWYDPKNPNYSSLQKHFPLRECVYTAILWGLFLYFLWLYIVYQKQIYG